MKTKVNNKLRQGNPDEINNFFLYLASKRIYLSDFKLKFTDEQYYNILDNLYDIYIKEKTD